MSKKPTIKANFRKTPSRPAQPAIAKPVAPESVALESATEASVEPAAVIEPVAEEAPAAPTVEETVAQDVTTPAEPVAQEAAVDETVIADVPAEETPAAEVPVEAPAATAPVEPAKAEPAEPIAKKPARKPAPRKPVAAPVSPTPPTEAQAPTVEVSAQTPSPTEPAAQPPRWPNIFAKEFAMSTFPSFDFAAPFQTAFADLQEKAKTAYEKGNSVFGDYSEFAKGNVEAFVESGKILAAGLQELTSAYVSEGRAGFETLTAEVKELAAAKSPTDFLKLQNDLAKKHFDEVVASASKHSEALVKLANEAAQPISTRVTLAVEKIKTAA